MFRYAQGVSTGQPNRSVLAYWGCEGITKYTRPPPPG